MNEIETLDLLQDLGFTRLEAQIFVFLLGESPATGYRIAQAIGKPAANTYKALETLGSKGAVMVDHEEKRLFRAVPYEEVLSHLERRFQDRKSRVEEALASLPESPDDDRIYQIRSVEGVYERFQAMLSRVKRIAFLDLTPLTLERLLPDIEESASRGINITMKVYEPIEIPGVKVVEDTQHALFEYWPSQCVVIVADVLEYMNALFTMDGSSLRHAFWTRSANLTIDYTAGLKREVVLDQINAILEKDGPIEEVKRLAKSIWDEELLEAPGCKAAMKQFKKP
jgi:sugar-specific transcriptional regulator TrmB